MYPCTNRDGEREQSQNHSAVFDGEKNNFDHVPCVPVQDCCQTKIKNLNQQQQRSIRNHPSSCSNSSSYEQLEDRVKTLEKELHFLRAKSRKDDEWKKLIQNWIYQQHEQKLRDFKNQLSQLTEFDADPDVDLDRPLFNTRVPTATATRCHSVATFQSSQYQQEDDSGGGGNGICSQSQLFKPSYSRCDTTSTTNTTSMDQSGSTSSPCTIPGLPASQLMEPKAGSSETCSQINHRHNNVVGRYSSSVAISAGTSQESALSGFFLPIPMNPLSISMTSPTPANTVEAPVIVPLTIDGQQQQRGARNRSPSFHNSTSNNCTNSQLSPQLKISSIRTVTYPAPSSVESATSSFGKDPLPTTTTQTTGGTGTGNVIFPASNIFITNSNSSASVTSKISITEDDVIEISDDSEDEDSLLENDMEMEFPEQDQEQDSCQLNDQNFSATYFHVGYGTELKTELIEEAAALGPDQNVSNNGRIVTDAFLNKPAEPSSSSSASISANFNSTIATIATTSEASSDACKDKDSGGITSGKCKPRVCRDWRKICTYPTFQDARNDIMSSKAYTYRCKTESGCGTKTVYACKWYQKTRCPVALYVLQPTTEEAASGSASSSGLDGEGNGGTSSDQVSVYETIGIVHNHTNYNARKACSGPGGGGGGGMRTDSNTGSSKKRQVRLSGEVQNIVRHLFAEGIRKPTGLMAAINKRCPEVKIEMSHLKLFVIRLKQEYAQE